MPPRGPVPTRMSLRTSSGRSRAICWATCPPIENPKMSICSSPRASTSASASAAISAMLVFASPVVDPMPALSNKMTSRFAAKPSVMADRSCRDCRESAARGAMGPRRTSEATVGEGDVPGGYEPSRGGVMRFGHGASLSGGFGALKRVTLAPRPWGSWRCRVRSRLRAGCGCGAT